MMTDDVLPYGASTYSKSWVAWGHDDPLYVTHGQDWRTFDESGTGLCDCAMGLGSVILGHRNSRVDAAIRHQLSAGTTLSLATHIELAAARRVLKYFPADSMLQWGVNGSDATTGACRLARLITGRDRIAKWLCGYHGFHDWAVTDTNRGHGVEKTFKTFGFGEDWVSQIEQWPQDKLDIAAIIVEPDIHPQHLETLRAWCTKNDAFLIFDEVMTWGRYPKMLGSSNYGVQPDLWCLGKALGNGMPVSAIVGSAAVMRRFAPLSNEPNAFFSMSWGGHPLSLAAVIATLDVLEEHDGARLIWKRAEELHRFLANLSLDYLDRLSSLTDIGSPPFNRVTWRSPPVARAWRRLMRQAGVLIYAAHNLSLAHDDNAIKRIIDAWHYVVQHADQLDAASTEIYANSGIMRR
jgi:glutamate-1-semialdehyde aminotransferase